MAASLEQPAFYAPWMKGIYEVSPNLRPFGVDFGNGVQDRRLFQFDSDYPRYRESKMASMAECREKYVARQDLSAQVEQRALSLAMERLREESPDLMFGKEDPKTLDDLFLYLQEDVAIVTKNADRDWIAYVNVCNPSHWLPTEKIGRSFFDAHTPVPGFERINAVAGAMVESMVSKGPFVRFVWGLESDDQLNHHPVAPPGRDQTEWYGRQFVKGLFVRVERQVLWPLPEVCSALFTIRPYVYSIDLVKRIPGAWAQLVKAYQSMKSDALAYKGLPTGLLP